MDKDKIRFDELKGILTNKIDVMAAQANVSASVKARLESYRKRYEIIEAMQDGPDKAAAISRLVADLDGV